MINKDLVRYPMEKKAVDIRLVILSASSNSLVNGEIWVTVAIPPPGGP